MKIQQQPPLHLTYCLNVHPGETWDDNLAAIRTHALKVRRQVAPLAPFGLGLRLSFQAAAQLVQPHSLADFRDFLAAEDLYVFTINGFAYGRFHDATVKQEVYAPDWRMRERHDYTILLAEVLAQLLPEDLPGSISTVPGSYKTWIHCDEDVRMMAETLARVARHLAGIRKRTGRIIRLALEPEPDCYIETTAEAVNFFTGPLRHLGGRYLRSRPGLSLAESERVLLDHVGVCLDTAHAAVQFEPPDQALRRLLDAEIAVPKVQLSSALQARPDDDTLERLKDFCDPVYLHQVKVRRPDGRLIDFTDLHEALASQLGRHADYLWRIHFHVPLFFERHEGLESTSQLLCGQFAHDLRGGSCGHLEIETYTFNVLPDFLRRPDVTDSIADEYRWVLREIARP